MNHFKDSDFCYLIAHSTNSIRNFLFIAALVRLRKCLGEKFFFSQVLSDTLSTTSHRHLICSRFTLFIIYITVQFIYFTYKKEIYLIYAWESHNCNIQKTILTRQEIFSIVRSHNLLTSRTSKQFFFENDVIYFIYTHWSTFPYTCIQKQFNIHTYRLQQSLYQFLFLRCFNI